MNGKKLAILGLIAAAMVILAVVQSRISNAPAKLESKEPTYLIQGLNPNEIGSIIIAANKKTVTLKRDNSGFAVAEKENYPAQMERVNSLISSCLDIQTAESFPTDKTNFKDLGVTEEDAKAVVKFYKPDSTLMTGVVVGKEKEQGQGTFVRPVLGDDVYVTLSAPYINDSNLSYINQQLVSLTRDDIEMVTVSGPNENYVLKDSNGLKLENMPEGKELKNIEAETVFAALGGMTFDDVTRQDKDLKFDRKFVCKLKDSSVYTLDIAQKGGKTYMKCNADFLDKSPVTKKKELESQEELKKKEAKLLAEEKVERFKKQTAGWIYEIPDYKTVLLTKKLSDLVQDKPKPKEPNSPAEPNSRK